MSFAIGGTLRFLSHAETLRVFQRACARARLPVKFTEGFNPHPKLSLPLPRPVGVASDDELLVLRLFDQGGLAVADSGGQARQTRQDQVGKSLGEELPDAITVGPVTLEKSNASFLADSADYVFPLRPADDNGLAARLRRRSADLMGRESLVMERTAPKRPVRRIDIRGFLKSLSVLDDGIVATCAIGAGGSVRVDEIMALLELTPTDLAGPIRRTNVAWKVA